MKFLSDKNFLGNYPQILAASKLLQDHSLINSQLDVTWLSKSLYYEERRLVLIKFTSKIYEMLKVDQNEKEIRQDIQTLIISALALPVIYHRANFKTTEKRTGVLSGIKEFLKIGSFDNQLEEEISFLSNINQKAKDYLKMRAQSAFIVVDSFSKIFSLNNTDSRFMKRAVILFSIYFGLVRLSEFSDKSQSKFFSKAKAEFVLFQIECLDLLSKTIKQQFPTDFNILCRWIAKKTKYV